MSISILNSIICGDSKELLNSLEDESVDLILTDPIYSNLDDYLWLKNIASVKVKPEGNILAFTNGKWLLDTIYSS